LAKLDSALKLGLSTDPVESISMTKQKGISEMPDNIIKALEQLSLAASGST